MKNSESIESRKPNQDSESIEIRKPAKNSALRYMIKQFLIELYTNWRALEGLEVSRPYHEAKLGYIHGKSHG